jgi:hypothetical protein
MESALSGLAIAEPVSLAGLNPSAAANMNRTSNELMVPAVSTSASTPTKIADASVLNSNSVSSRKPPSGVSLVSCGSRV